MIVIEVTSNSMKLDGRKIEDLSSELAELDKCIHVHFLVDKNLEHTRVVEVINVAEEAKCEKVSIQSV